MSIGARILVIEDEMIVAEDLRSKVSALGYRVIDATSSGEEALQIAAEQRPDLVLLDITLRGKISGLQTAAELTRLYDIPVVYVTAHSDKETVKQATLVGHYGYVLKPFSERDLGIQIDIALYKSQTAKALRENEERWQLAVAGSTDGIWDWDIIHRTTFLSSRWKEIRGYADHEIGGDEREWSSRIHPDDYSMVMQTVQLYLERKISRFECQYRTRCKSGEYLWIIDRGMAIWDSNGRPIRMVGSETDITERKRAEDALREKENELELIVNRTPFLLTHCTRDLRYQFVSRAYADMLGRTAEELAGQRIVDVLGETGFATIRPYVEQVLKGESVTYQADIAFSRIGIRSLHVNYTPNQDAAGNVTGWVASILDLTERHQAERQLRESELRFRTMADSAPVLIWMADTTKLCTWFNDPWLQFTGSTMEKQIGDGWVKGVHPEDLERCLSVYTSHFDAREAFKMEYRLCRHDGEYRWVLDHGLPRYADSGEFLGYIGSCIDVTERRKAEDALKAVALLPSQNPFPVLRIDRKGILLYMNPASSRLLQQLNLVVGNHVSQELTQSVQASLQTSHVTKIERAIGARSYLVTITPVCEEGYANLYWTDITERKELEQLPSKL